MKEMKIHKKEKEENFLKIRYVHLLVVGWLCVGCAPFTNKYLVEMYWLSAFTLVYRLLVFA